MQSRSRLFFCIYSYGLYIFYTVKYLDFFPLKHPNRLLQTYSEFPCRKTLDDPKWTNHISRGIIVVCDVKVTLRGFGPRGEASGRAGCISRSRRCALAPPELDPRLLREGRRSRKQQSIDKKAAYVILFNSGFVVFRLSNGKSSSPCVCVCACVSLRALC